MSMHRRVFSLLLICWMNLAGAGEQADSQANSQGNDPAIDPATGLIIAGDWSLVRNHCVACHSARLITQQRGTADQWLGIIRWMQATQNLAQFDPSTEAKIVGYLATYYPPGKRRRRAPVPRALMPANLSSRTVSE